MLRRSQYLRWLSAYTKGRGARLLRLLNPNDHATIPFSLFLLVLYSALVIILIVSLPYIISYRLTLTNCQLSSSALGPLAWERCPNGVPELEPLASVSFLTVVFSSSSVVVVVVDSLR